ncbi:hypothetical protein VDG1235_3771 [Verrucomicrobiia bacterium DG1235]|nr:hypothetical protein VDG1235_3771 [Verrucomicrobiae bacterium DG1235]
MAEAEKQKSIFSEMAERRSRCDDLNARAVDHGLEVFQADDSDSELDETEVELKPAFAMDEIEESLVSKNKIQPAAVVDKEALDSGESILDEIEDGLESPVEGLEAAVDFGERVIDNVEPPSALEPTTQDEQGSEDLSEASIELEASVELTEQEPETPLPVGEFEVTSEVSDDSEILSEETEPDAGISPEVSEEAKEGEMLAEVESGSASYFDDIEKEAEAPIEEEETSKEELIEQSEELLAAEPEPVVDAEVAKVAEDLVDRIGPVVDIQSLPKTQPSRVLSKTAKPKEDPNSAQRPELDEPLSVPPVEDRADRKAVDEGAPAKKKKKKKVSVLDSYFKGL